MALFQAPTKDSGKAPSKAPLLESGGYPARLVRLIDLGKQPGSGQFPDPAYKMLGTFELLEEYMKEVDEAGNIIMIQDPDGEPGEMIGKDLLDKPRWFDFEFTYNPDGFMGDRSHIYKFMAAVDAFEVKPNPEAGIAGHPAKQLNELLGEPLVVNLTQYTKKGGKNAGQMANKISTFAPMKSKDKRDAKALVNPTIFFDLGAPDLEVFGKLPGGDQEWAVKNRILANLDFNGSKLQELLGIAKTPDAPVENKATPEQVDEALAAELAAQAAAKAKLAEQNGGADAAAGQPF
ncbi:hypothetical protein pEaSNUABM27_00042 [Erwinia phage pEa_SNUABM_27]|nr:hypothetical protein pEaSNUABM27_00042 [Erwinia phage pEa_SNUABM_27]